MDRADRKAKRDPICVYVCDISPHHKHSGDLQGGLKMIEEKGRSGAAVSLLVGRKSSRSKGADVCPIGRYDAILAGRC